MHQMEVLVNKNYLVMNSIMTVMDRLTSMLISTQMPIIVVFVAVCVVSLMQARCVVWGSV